MKFEDWEDFFDFGFGPLNTGMGASLRPFRSSYARTKDSHILRLRLNPELKKTDIKVRLQKDGVLEVEWPWKTEGEEIPIE